MSGQELGLAVSVFLACAVEAVEALTIVLAVGTTRSWRSALSGAAAAVLALAVTTAILGPGLTSLPIDTLRLVVGGLLLVFGLQWLRKAILRGGRPQGPARRGGDLPRGGGGGQSGGRAADGVRRLLVHDRLQGSPARGPGGRLHRPHLRREPAPPRPGGRCRGCGGPDRGRDRRRCPPPARHAPENAMKFSVGVMLTSFGIFWGAEGAGARLARRRCSAARPGPDRAGLLAPAGPALPHARRRRSGGGGVRRIRDAAVGSGSS